MPYIRAYIVFGTQADSSANSGVMAKQSAPAKTIRRIIKDMMEDPKNAKANAVAQDNGIPMRTTLKPILSLQYPATGESNAPGRIKAINISPTCSEL